MGVVVTESGGILTVKRDDVRPHISRVRFQLVHCDTQIYAVLVTEETVGADAFRTGTGCNVLCVLLRALHRFPVGFQRQRDKCRGGCLGWFGSVVLILIQRFAVRKIFCEFCDEQLLLSCGRTVVRNDLHTLTGSDVLEVSTDTTIAFDVGAFENQFYHS